MNEAPSIRDPAAAGLEPAGDGRMWLDARFRARLGAAGLSGFDDVMHSLDGRCLRELKIRENWYLPAGDDAPAGMYLKKHRRRSWLGRLCAWLGFDAQSPARLEAQNAVALTADGIAVMQLVAYGERLHADGLLESFLLTEELHGFVDLEKWLARNAPAAATSPQRSPRLLVVIEAVAQLAARFHGAGYNHRDFYGCHIFVRELPDGLELRLIDLQRIQRRRWFRRRWIVKDLAQLAWSASQRSVKATHRLRFIKHYLGVRKLRAKDKRLIREVLDKQYVMQRRLGVR
jgi:heptose I phosphotransferase